MFSKTAGYPPSHGSQSAIRHYRISKAALGPQKMLGLELCAYLKNYTALLSSCKRMRCWGNNSGVGLEPWDCALRWHEWLHDFVKGGCWGNNSGVGLEPWHSFCVHGMALSPGIALCVGTDSYTTLLSSCKRMRCWGNNSGVGLEPWDCALRWHEWLHDFVKGGCWGNNSGVGLEPWHSFCVHGMLHDFVKRGCWGNNSGVGLEPWHSFCVHGMLHDFVKRGCWGNNSGVGLEPWHSFCVHGMLHDFVKEEEQRAEVEPKA
ncbi:hypothetical protein BX666DRAFT_1880251 [Dichotomocladium elegans]|nr:hypothetical protein BX666DRAFT_1880251 [Dichotomocladium elegans]